MALWDDVRGAARDARENRHRLRERLAGMRTRAARRDASLVLTLDGKGRFVAPGEMQGLAVLGQSLLALALAAASMALSWLTTWALAAYLFLQRLLGLQVTLAGR